MSWAAWSVPAPLLPSLSLKPFGCVQGLLCRFQLRDLWQYIYIFIFFCQNLRAANTNSKGNFAFSGDSLPCPFHKWVVSQPDGAGAAQLPKLTVPRSLRFSVHHFRAQDMKENQSGRSPARCAASTTAPYLLLQMHPDHFASGKINK